MTSMVGYLYDATARACQGSIKTWGSCDPTINGFQIQSDYVLGPLGAGHRDGMIPAHNGLQIPMHFLALSDRYL